jgi:hypothetical protein
METDWLKRHNLSCRAEENHAIPVRTTGFKIKVRGFPSTQRYYRRFLLFIIYLTATVPGYRPRGSGFDSRCYQIFWEVVGLERGPLSLVSTLEELLGIKNSDSGLEIREYGRREQPRWPRGTLYPQKLTLTSPTSGGQYSSLADSGYSVFSVLFILCITSPPLHRTGNQTGSNFTNLLTTRRWPRRVAQKIRALLHQWSHLVVPTACLSHPTSMDC